MKKSITLFLLLFAAATATAQTWENVGQPGFTPSHSENLITVVDPSGTPYIAYANSSGGSDDRSATVQKFNGTSWENVGEPNFSATYPDKVPLAFNASGTPYAAYRDSENNNKLTVQKFNGTSWENVGIPGFSSGTPNYISIAIDASGTPYVAYANTLSISTSLPGMEDSKATVMKFNGTAWENVGMPDFSAGNIYYPSFAISASGTPYVAYIDLANYYKATVMTFNGAAWENVGMPGLSAGEIRDPSIVIDAFGTPYLGYSDGSVGGRATIMKFNGSSWENVGAQGFSPDFADYFSLAFSGSGTLYAGYRDSANNGSATLAKFDGNSWVNVGAPGFTHNYVHSLSFAIDASGYAYAGYSDGNYSGPYGLSATVSKICAECEVTTITQLAPAYCGITLTQLNDNLLATPVQGATKYKFRVTDGTTTNTVIRTDNVFRVNMLPSYAYNTVYTVDVSALIDGVWADFGAPCTVTTPVAPVSQLTSQDCGATVANFGINIYADAALLATGYRFRVATEDHVQTIDKNVRYFRLNELTFYSYGTTYTVEVAVGVNGVFGAYGPACTITTTVPVTQLNAASCGTTVPRFSTNLYATALPLAEGYSFKVTNGENVQTLESTANYFRLSQLTSYQYRTAYTVEVAVKINGAYGPYGQPCPVYTPAPVTQLRAQDCGTTVVRFGTNLYADDVLLAQGYLFRVTNGEAINIVNRPNRNFRVSMLPSYTYNTTYTVDVAVLVDGVWSDFGPACEVSTPVSGMRQNMANNEDAVIATATALTAFPNPFETSFTLALETESNEAVTIQAYDIMGKMLDNRTVSAEELSDLRIGENYAAGIYSVIVSQGSYTKVVKMVKK